MSQHGGARKGAGRKPKTEEQEKIELISSVIPKKEVIELCAIQAQKGNMKAIELLMYYLLGKPKDSVDVTSDGDTIKIPISTWTRTE